MPNADLTPDEFAAAVAAVTTAFGDPTRRDIYLFVRASRRRARPPPRSPSDSRSTPTSPATTSRSSRAAATSTSSSPATNRPAGRRSATARSADDTHLAFPPRRDDLLATLLARALERLPGRRGPHDRRGGRARVRARDRGADGADRGAPFGEGRGRVGRRRAHRARFRRARRDARATLLTLVAEHCPFGEAAQQYPHVLCAVDTGMVKGMLEGLYGETAAAPSSRVVPTATTTASPASEASACVRAYLDHASSSPLRPAALDAMLPYLGDHYADPGRLHAEGRATRVALETAREQVAAFFGARPARSCSRRRAPRR